MDIFDNNSLCNICWSKLSLIGSNHSIKCNIPPIDEIDCYNNKKYYSQVKAAIIYDEDVAKLIYNFKYYDNEYMKKPLSNLMIQAGRELIKESDVIIPVPLHVNRLRFRKFNQAAALAQQISKNNHLRFLPQALIRSKDTVSQSGLSRIQRYRNINEAFSINQKYVAHLKDKRVLLIDDVFTTGSTVNACAKILSVNGALDVVVLTIAQTADKSLLN